MTRRTYIKIIVSVGLLGFLFFWFGRKIGFYRVPDLSVLQQKKNLITELTETIIPQTDSPGAAQANVAEFVIDYVRDCAPVNEQRNFARGLMKLEKYSLRTYGCSFVECKSADRIAILERFEDDAVSRISIINKINNKLFGKPFIGQLKELTVEGYCTSELGATQGLAYDYIPVHYEACTFLGVEQKSWATK